MGSDNGDKKERSNQASSRTMRMHNSPTVGPITAVRTAVRRLKD